MVQISKALFKSDPINTCYKANGCYDEYDSIAEAVSKSLQARESLPKDIKKEVSHRLYDGETVDTAILGQVFNGLNEVESDR